MLFFVFLFSFLKYNVVLKPRTGHFRGLKGFEAKTKAKDLSFEAKAGTSKCDLEDSTSA